MFKDTFVQVMGYEGLYSNDVNDTGGETVFGISRNNHPTWSGWAVIDSLAGMHGRGTSSFKQAIQTNEPLKTSVEAFYKENYWDPFGLDKVTSPEICFEIFDQAVNLGIGRTTKFIQQAFNAFNYQRKFGADLLVDGKCGPVTRDKLQLISADPLYVKPFKRALDSLQANHYISLGQSEQGTSNYRKYMRGWLDKRVG